MSTITRTKLHTGLRVTILVRINLTVQSYCFFTAYPIVVQRVRVRLSRMLYFGKLSNLFCTFRSASGLRFTFLRVYVFACKKTPSNSNPKPSTIFDSSRGSKFFLLVKSKFPSRGLDKKTLTPYHLTSLIGGTHMPECPSFVKATKGFKDSTIQIQKKYISFIYKGRACAYDLEGGLGVKVWFDRLTNR